MKRDEPGKTYSPHLDRELLKPGVPGNLEELLLCQDDERAAACLLEQVKQKNRDWEKAPALREQQSFVASRQPLLQRHSET